MTIKKLTPKRQRFCDEYLIDLNATQATIRAGYSKNGARTMGGILLSDIDISNQIVAKFAKRSESVGITAQKVIQDLVNIANTDYTELVETAGSAPGRFRLVDIDSLSQAQRAAIKQLKFKSDGIVEVELYDKQKIHELLAKHTGALSDRQTGQQDRVVFNFIGLDDPIPGGDDVDGEGKA